MEARLTTITPSMVSALRERYGAELDTLNLSDNAISVIENLAPLTSLTELDLSRQQHPSSRFFLSPTSHRNCIKRLSMSDVRWALGLRGVCSIATTRLTTCNHQEPADTQSWLQPAAGSSRLTICLPNFITMRVALHRNPTDAFG